MYYSFSKEQQEYFLSQPETGMGYQVIEATPVGTYLKREYIILNSQVAIDYDFNYSLNIRKVISEGILNTNRSYPKISFSNLNIKVLSENEFRNNVNEPTGLDKAAINSPKVYADGKEYFIRLSAFQDDKRIDRIKLCLRPGSFATTKINYEECKTVGDDPIERYALPSEDKIEWIFYIQPKNVDLLQRGKVQQANNKRGGGEEVFFELGTSEGTFKGEAKY